MVASLILVGTGCQPPNEGSGSRDAALNVTAVTGGPAVCGDAVIRAPAGGSEIVIKTSSRMAGAIESLQWGGKEFTP